MTEDLRFRTPHKAGNFHWYEEEWGISIYLTNDSKHNCGIRWNVLKKAMQRADKQRTTLQLYQPSQRKENMNAETQKELDDIFLETVINVHAIITEKIDPVGAEIMRKLVEIARRRAPVQQIFHNRLSSHNS